MMMLDGTVKRLPGGGGSPRFGYPTKRKVPEKGKITKKAAYGRHLLRYLYCEVVRNVACSKSSTRLQEGSFLVYHATKGWRKL